MGSEDSEKPLNRYPSRHACCSVDKDTTESTAPSVQLGLTLFECLIVLSTIALIAALAVPSLSGMIENAQTASLARRLHVSLVLARSEAIKRRQTVSVCASTSLLCADSSRWAQGWIVFSDNDSNGQRDGSEPLLWREMTSGSDLEIRFAGGASAHRFVRFTAHGSGWPNGTFYVCAGSVQKRRVVFYFSGRSRIARPEGYDCPKQS